MSWDDIDWGNAPSWGALAAAVVAASLAAGAYRREGRRDQVNQRIRLQEQAAKVGAWPVGLTDRGRTVLVRYVNKSDFPVRSFVVVGAAPVPQSEDFEDGFERVSESTLVLEADENEVWELPFTHVVNLNKLELEVYFTDAQGVRWVRTDGQLDLLVSDEQPQWVKTLQALASGFTLVVGPLSLNVDWGFRRAIDWLRNKPKS